MCMAFMHCPRPEDPQSRADSRGSQRVLKNGDGDAYREKVLNISKFKLKTDTGKEGNLL